MFPLQRRKTLSQKRTIQGRNFQSVTIHLSRQLPKEIVPGKKRVMPSSTGASAGKYQDILRKGAEEFLHQEAFSYPRLARDVHAPGSGSPAFAKGFEFPKLPETTKKRSPPGRKFLFSQQFLFRRRRKRIPGKKGRVVFPGFLGGKNFELFPQAFFKEIVYLDNPVSTTQVLMTVHEEAGNFFIQIIPSQKFLHPGKKFPKLLPRGRANPASKPFPVEPEEKTSLFPQPGFETGTSSQGKTLHKRAPQGFQSLERKGFQRFQRVEIPFHTKGTQNDTLPISSEKSRRKLFSKLIQGIAQIPGSPLLLPISPEKIRQLFPRGPAFHHKVAGQSLHLAKGKGQNLFLKIKSGLS
jgi:hypothetical protein